jgi:hypothetical protein
MRRKAAVSALFYSTPITGLLDPVGFATSFNSQPRQELKEIVGPLVGGSGFTGRAPGGPGRWSTERSTELHSPNQTWLPK